MVEQNSVCLVIIDGWGHSESKKNYQGDVPTTDRNDTHLDAISHARTLFYDNLLIKHGFLTLCASGLAVGLPENTIGNSQVGHITIGAGRCVKQPLLKIWDLFRNKEIPKILKEKGLFKRTQNSLHLIGLASDGGVHSHIDHLFLLIDIFSSSQAYDKIVLHLITDGRDTHPMSCLRYIRRISEHIEMINRKLNIDLIKIGSISGRWYTMDRDNNRERYECAFQVMTGDAHIQVMTGDAHTLDDTSITDFNKIERYVLDCYEKNPTDEMIAPFLVNINCKIKKQDRIFFSISESTE